jgi:hypothetical protein
MGVASMHDAVATLTVGLPTGRARCGRGELTLLKVMHNGERVREGLEDDGKTAVTE